MKRIDLDPLPPVTRVYVLRVEDPDRLYPPPFKENIPDVIAFIDRNRFAWKRAIGVGFGPPSPVRYMHLFDGDRYVGYFAVGAGVLPGSAAFFQVRYGDVFAQKRVTAAEANRFLDLIGEGGKLAETVNSEVTQQIAKRPTPSRGAILVERPAKFQPGDKVRVKLTGAEGTVFLRTKFFREDRYFITLPGSHYVFETIADRTRREAWRAESTARSREWARSHGMAEHAFDVPEDQPRPWHEEGPFYQSELELVR